MEVNINKKDLVIAYLFLFHLGVFGGHKFYLRKPGMGILYLFINGTALKALIMGYEIIQEELIVNGIDRNFFESMIVFLLITGLFMIGL